MTGKPTESSEEFLELIRKWQVLEDKTIKSAEAIIGASKNPFITMIMDMIRHDSEKHRVIQQMIIDSITKEAIHISPDELNQLSEGLNRHLEAEAESLCLADAALAKSELFFTRFLLSYLIADEAKHHGLISQLNDVKRAVIPTSTGARSFGYAESAPSNMERAKGKKH
jgi:hypothetical protein